MVKIINCGEIAQKIKDSVKNEIAKNSYNPGLAVILIGNNPASKLYTKLKIKSCEETGIHSEVHEFEENTNEKEILKKIEELNQNKKIDGILIQLPLPKNYNTVKIIEKINPKKDVDGIHPLNLGKLSTKTKTIIPCTPKGIMKILESITELKGKNIVIINHSNTIGKPLANLLLNKGSTITICHKDTTNLKQHTLMADIIISATGTPNLIDKDMIKKDSIIIDAGISKKAGKIVGDVNSNVEDKAKYLTSVPGGVGPMTISMLLDNCLILHKEK